MSISAASYQRNGSAYLVSKGWLVMVNSVHHAYWQLGTLKMHDLDAALDHQRFLDEQEYERRIAARPRFMWGADVAEAMGFA